MTVRCDLWFEVVDSIGRGLGMGGVEDCHGCTLDFELRLIIALLILIPTYFSFICMTFDRDRFWKAAV